MPRPSPAKSGPASSGAPLLRRLRQLLFLFAGVLLGAGLLLFGQVRFARHVKGEVRSKLFLLRLIGYATFIFQGTDVQVALAIDRVPDEALEHSQRVAITLIVVGVLLLASTPWVRKRRA